MNPLESPWNAVFAASLRGSALILCVLAVRWLLRGRLPAGALHLLWLLVAVRLVLPGAPSSSWSVFNLAHRAPVGAVADAGWQVRSFVEPAGTADAGPKALGEGAVLKKETWSATDALPWLWAAGVTVQIVLLGWSALAVRRRLGGAVIIEDARFLRLAEECREQLGLRRRVTFLESAELAGPAVLGLWRPRLVMPPGLIARLSDEELRFVLLHELAHVRRHDLAALWLLTAARVLHWFNPLVWLAAHTARGDAELACDETVLRHAHDTAPTAYGAALLKLVQLASWRPTALPMAGITERAGALKERLARIADYAPGSVRRSVFTALVVLGVGVVFGADEKKKDAAPAAATTETTIAPQPAPSTDKPPTEPPAWSKGWSVARVVIPSDGEIKVAYVDLLPPDGKPITLSPGVQTKDGVMLSSVGLVWSPARAVVRLRKGQETAELFVDAALISKSETLKRATGQVEIEGRFIEVSEAVALTLKDPAGKSLFPTLAAVQVGNPKSLPQISYLLKAGDQQTYLADLKKMKGVDLLSAPRVTTKSGQRAVIEIIREFPYPTEWEKAADKKGQWVPTTFETRNTGVTLEIEPTITMENTLDLLLTPQVVEYLGAVDVDTGKPVKTPALPAPLSTATNALGQTTVKLPPVAVGPRVRPVFSTRKITTSVSIFSGQSVILTGFGETEDTKPFKPKTPGRRLIVIITARQIAAE